MKKIIAILLALIISSTAIVTMAAAPQNTEDYIRLSDIEGISENCSHAKWIDVIDYTLDYKEDGELKGITFTHLIEPATTRILDCYMKGVYIRDGKFEACQSIAGRQRVVRTVEMEKIKIAKVEVIQLEDGRVAETVTLAAENASCVDTPIEQEW